MMQFSRTSGSPRLRPRVACGSALLRGTGAPVVQRAVLTVAAKLVTTLSGRMGPLQLPRETPPAACLPGLRMAPAALARLAFSRVAAGLTATARTGVGALIAARWAAAFLDDPLRRTRRPGAGPLMGSIRGLGCDIARRPGARAGCEALP
jgi:hypothetical protein